MRNRAGEKATLENMTPEISPGIEERGGQNHNTETSLTKTGVQVNILLALCQMINYLTQQCTVQFTLLIKNILFCKIFIEINNFYSARSH